MTTMHHHAGGDVALAEDRLNITDPFFVFAEFVGIDFDTLAWQLQRHVDKGAMVLNTPSLCPLILRHKTVEGLLTIFIIVEEIPLNACILAKNALQRDTFTLGEIGEIWHGDGRQLRIGQLWGLPLDEFGDEEAIDDRGVPVLFLLSTRVFDLERLPK